MEMWKITYYPNSRLAHKKPGALALYTQSLADEYFKLATARGSNEQNANPRNLAKIYPERPILECALIMYEYTNRRH